MAQAQPGGKLRCRAKQDLEPQKGYVSHRFGSSRGRRVKEGSQEGYRRAAGREVQLAKVFKTRLGRTRLRIVSDQGYCNNRRNSNINSAFEVGYSSFLLTIETVAIL